MGGLTKREMVLIGIAFLISLAATVWGCFFFVNNVLADRNDPMTKQGGMKPEQRSPAKPSGS